jgi:hypothetical protein
MAATAIIIVAGELPCLLPDGLAVCPFFALFGRRSSESILTRLPHIIAIPDALWPVVPASARSHEDANKAKKTHHKDTKTPGRDAGTLPSSDPPGICHLLYRRHAGLRGIIISR